MKKLIGGILILALLGAYAPRLANADVDVHIGIGLPPLIFAGPPRLVMVPGPYCYYVVPGTALFFYNGWWWRPWHGHWYCSRNYHSGWVYYHGIPSFYRHQHSGRDWNHYEHNWDRHPRSFHPTPYHHPDQNWGGRR